MVKITKFSTVIIFTITIKFSENATSSDKPLIETTAGTLRGEKLSCGSSCKYYSFRGIPYAKPPVGKLRFRAPVSHPGWSGVRNATEHGKNCPSDFILGGINFGENCLTLNVYTKSLSNRLPVMMYLHGGAFFAGSGNKLIYGPDYFVDENVIIVTINYRLGALGFLSTLDNNAPGNYGLKDAVLALKWIRDNISRFGGDPDNVTIFGESAGGAFVHYLMLSPVARGLFARAISQSGSALCPWAFQPKPKTSTYRLARKLGLTWDNHTDLIKQLRQINYNDIVLATPSLINFPVPRGQTIFDFSPTIDPPDVSEVEAFLPEKPLQLVSSGSFQHIPYITGFNSDESLFMMQEHIIDANIFSTLNDNPFLLAPTKLWNLKRYSNEVDDIAKEIRRFYFKNSKISYGMRYEYSQYNTDLMFAYPISKTAKYHAVAQKEPVYMYRFSFDGTLNLLKTMLLITDHPGAMHSEELMYMFKVANLESNATVSGKSSYNTRRRMVRMWTNFAKYGDPTYEMDSIIKLKWEPIHNERQQYLEIDSNISTGEFPFKDRMEFWTHLENQYRKPDIKN